MPSVLAVVVSYLIGSIPFGYLMARIKGIDITELGSGNIGATNVWRNLGPVPGLLVFFLDMGKGVAAVLIGRAVGGPELELLTAMGALSGHSWSLFLRFKGGKMIATGAGVILAISPVLILVAFIVWITAVALSRYVSLGSMLAAVSVPVTMAALNMNAWHLAFGIVLAVLAVYKHRANIGRILDGTESKVSRGGWK